MSASRVSIPKYCRHKASGLAYVWVGKKRHYLGEFNTSESQERYAAFIAELAVKPSIEPTDVVGQHIIVTELCAAYWIFAQSYYVKNGKPSGWLAHIRLMLRKIRKLYGLTFANEFGPLKLKALRQTLIDQGHSRPYINKLVPIITRMFKWAAAEEIIPGSVYHSLRTIEGLRQGRTDAHETKPILPVDDDVVNGTLPHLPAVIADMVRFQRHTGMRTGEVCQIRPMDVDCTGEVWIYRPGSHKTEHHGKSRSIYIGPQAQNVIQHYLLRPTDSPCFSPVESEEKRRVEMRERRKTPVQPSQLNRRKSKPKRTPKISYDRNSYARAVNRSIKKANKKILEDAEHFGIDNPALIPHWHPNQLRHTAATIIRRDYGLEAAQVILGHSKADVTQIYAERDEAKAIDVIRKIG